MNYEESVAYLEQAASFGIKPGLERIEAMLKKLGLGKGGTLENTIVYDDTTCLSKLRTEDELVRHKVLDVIGDLALLGRPLQGHIVAVKSSHKLNNLLARKISEEIK